MGGRYRDPAEAPIWCTRKGYQVPMLSCLKCRKFPCEGISEDTMQILKGSAFVTWEFAGMVHRRVMMFIFKKTDGMLEVAPAGFDPDKPDPTLLEEVEEILVVSKVLVKQLRLVPKSKEEIAQVRQRKSKNVAGETPDKKNGQ